MHMMLTAHGPYVSYIIILMIPLLILDWVVNQGNIMNTNTSGGELALLLTEDNGGTRVSSTRYVHYATITATRVFRFLFAN